MEILANYHYLKLLISNCVHRAPHPINMVGAQYLAQDARDMFLTVDDGALSLRPIARKIGSRANEDSAENPDRLIII